MSVDLGTNLSSVTIRDSDIALHADRWPRTHLATVGPKSAPYVTKRGNRMEIFDPYVSCTVGEVRVENVRFRGKVPDELVHAVEFKDVNGDGDSSGAGLVKRLILPLGEKPVGKRAWHRPSVLGADAGNRQKGVLARTGDVFAQPFDGKLWILVLAGLQDFTVEFPCAGHVLEGALMRMRAEELVAPIGVDDDLFRKGVAGSAEKGKMKENVRIEL